MCAVTGPEDFLWLNREILFKDIQSGARGDSRHGGMDDIVIGENSDISPRSFLLGPLVIGPNCVVEDYVHLIGPAVIGPTSHLEKGSLVRESVLRSGTRVQGNARVEYSVVAGDGPYPRACAFGAHSGPRRSQPCMSRMDRLPPGSSGASGATVSGHRILSSGASKIPHPDYRRRRVVHSHERFQLLLEPVGVPADIDRDRVVEHPIQDRRREHPVPEHLPQAPKLWLLVRIIGPFS